MHIKFKPWTSVSFNENSEYYTLHTQNRNKGKKRKSEKERESDKVISDLTVEYKNIKIEFVKSNKIFYEGKGREERGEAAEAGEGKEDYETRNW